jgi:hypothetical protein
MSFDFIFSGLQWWTLMILLNLTRFYGLVTFVGLLQQKSRLIVSTYVIGKLKR